MAAKPITIGPTHFAKRGDALAFYKVMLKRYDVGDKVSAADEDLLRAVLALHPGSHREDRLRRNALQR